MRSSVTSTLSPRCSRRSCCCTSGSLRRSKPRRTSSRRTRPEPHCLNRSLSLRGRHHAAPYGAAAHVGRHQKHNSLVDSQGVAAVPLLLGMEGVDKTVLLPNLAAVTIHHVLEDRAAFFRQEHQRPA